VRAARRSRLPKFASRRKSSTILVQIGRGRPVDDFETLCARKDGTVFPVKLTVAPIRDVAGVVVSASAIARDVTEQK